ncbi:MAG: T9SS type A sorting domain-containing protein [Ignavibacteriaceae bacterium]|nr:T9SS type A sorting domain-containing protein [Ignavibacteriaceae bacterium]
MKLLKLFLFFVLITSIHAQELGKWNWNNPKPTGNTLQTSVLLNENNIVAFGEGATMITTTNSGLNWETTSIDSLGRTVNAVEKVSPLIWYAVGSGGLLVKTTDGGQSGFPLSTGFTDNFYDVDFIDADTGYITGAGGRVLKTTDGGLTWVAKNAGYTNNVYALQVRAANDVWVANSSTSAVKRSTDYGETWTTVAVSGLTQTIWDICWIDDQRGWLATQNGGRVYYTTDGGTTWSNTIVNNLIVPNFVLFLDANTGFVTNNNNGTIYKSTDGGLTYTGYATGTEPIYNISVFGSALVATGRYGSIYKSTDAGVTWVPLMNAITQKTFRRVKFVTEDLGYLLGGSSTTADSLGLIFKTTDGGATWSDMGANFKFLAYGLSMPSASTWFVSTGRNRIYKTTDAGTTWEWLSQPLFGTTAINEVAFADTLTGFAVTNSGRIIKTTNGGTSWDSLASPHGTTAIYAMHLFNANKVITVGGSAKAYMTTDGGANWTALTTNIPGNYFGLSFYNENHGVIVGYSSSANFVARTTDGGFTWTAYTPPANHTISNYGVVFEDTTTFWLLDQNGTMSRTTDGGNTWVQPFPTSFNGIFYATKIDRYLWAAGTGGTVLVNKWSSIIPVELTSFSASIVDGKASLKWTTASETNNRGFEVQRSIGDGQWSAIAFIDGAGNSLERNSYAFTDNQLLTVKTAYRIKQIDYDGTSSYSNVVELDPVAGMSFGLGQNYPNPFNPSTKIFYEVGTPSDVTIKLYDVLGNEVRTIVSAPHLQGKYYIQFDAEGLSSGTYFYRMDAGKFSQTRKLNLIK